MKPETDGEAEIIGRKSTNEGQTSSSKRVSFFNKVIRVFFFIVTRSLLDIAIATF